MLRGFSAQYLGAEGIRCSPRRRSCSFACFCTTELRETAREVSVPTFGCVKYLEEAEFS